MPVALDDVREILVRVPNWVGDVVMTTPGLRALRAGFPAARITVQVRPGLEGLLVGSPYVDRLIPVASYHAGVPALLREAGSLRKQRFDLGVCIPESFSSALLQRLAGVKCVAGYGGGWRNLLLHRRLPVPAAWGRRRLVAREDFVLNLIENLGCKRQGERLELAVTPAEEEGVERTLARHGIEEGERIVAMAPGASFGPSKWWPAASFAQVGDALIRLGIRVVLIGSASEVDLSRRVALAMHEEPTDLTGVLDLGCAKALICRSSMVICNDAGARHVAVAFGISCIVFMGPTSLAKTNRNLDGIRVFETDVSCRPCYERDCPIDHPCMKGILPEKVVAAAREILGVSD